MPEQYQCAETGRTFTTAEAARASEERFREIQDACAAGQVPALRKGDVIYIGTELYLGHGRDDFRGGLAEVIEVRPDISKGKPTPFIRVAQQKTGAPLNIHPYASGKHCHELLDILKDASAPLDKVVLSHIDEAGYDPEYTSSLAKRGCYVEFDTFGLEIYFF